MGFSDAAQWWDEWQLRSLVLGSLFIQYFLFFSSLVRTCALRAWLRLFIWLAYTGGDALAIYALTSLFNRHKQLPADGSSLEVLWTPVLLIHLGGQHPVTAYSIEDNELSTRHAITVVSQVTVALYVFCKSWSGEKRLLQAAILLFIVGIIRSVQKPWALKNGSISGMVASSSPSTQREQGLFASFWEFCIFMQGSELSESGRQEEEAEEKDISLEKFVQEARRCVLLAELASDQDKAKELATKSMERYAYRLLVDITTPYTSRIKILQLLMALDCRHAHWVSEFTLNWLFGALYTNWNIVFSGLGLCLHLLLPFVTLASVILFSTSHKYHDYNAADVKVTYILFCCTLPLDFSLLLLGPFIIALGFVKVSQYSLLSFYARKKRPTTLMKLATVVCCKDYVNMHCYIEHQPYDSSETITELVLGYLRNGWQGYINDTASYKRFNSHRGEWTLNKHRLGHAKQLGWSLKMAFDRSVLLWHIAMDLCFHHQSTTPYGQEQRAAQSRVISNYLVYLLSIRPEMLMLGTRNGIFSIACEDIELMMGGELAPDVRGLAQGILHMAQQPPSSHASSNIGALVPNACRLAKALMELQDEEERWEVVQGVWVEMLCYSASRCRGYLHAKNMNEGSELLSHVWILLSVMGMETSADRYQKSEPPETKEEEEEVEGGDISGEGGPSQHEINISV